MLSFLLAQLDAMATDGATRVAGENRYATAAAISAQAFPTGVPVAYVGTGATFPEPAGVYWDEVQPDQYAGIPFLKELRARIEALKAERG